MNQFTKRDKTILVIFVLLHILVSSIARVAGINMATSISLLGFSFLYIIYILFSRSKKKQNEANNQSIKTVSSKIDSKFWMIFLLLFIIGFVFYWFELRPAKFRSYCDWSIKYGPDYKEGLTLQNFELRYRSCLRSKGIEK